VNGDDWFYFEDETTSSDLRAEMVDQLKISTISGSDTTLVDIRYKETPHHVKLHDGACRFAGLKPQGGSRAWDMDTEMARKERAMRVQEL
jgi:hypothetical protein